MVMLTANRCELRTSCLSFLFIVGFFLLEEHEQDTNNYRYSVVKMTLSLDRKVLKFYKMENENAAIDEKNIIEEIQCSHVAKVVIITQYEVIPFILHSLGWHQ